MHLQHNAMLFIRVIDVWVKSEEYISTVLFNKLNDWEFMIWSLNFFQRFEAR